jgi:hypothetical protein
LEIFTVIDERFPGAAAPEWLAAHEEAVRLFRQRDFAGASERFRAVLQAVPEDWLAADYLEHCQHYEKEPPPADWNAVDVMRSM